MSPARLSGWFVVVLLGFAGLLNYFDRLLLTTVAEPMIDAFQIDTGRFGLLSSVFLWCYALCSPLAGCLADRFGYARTVAGSLVAWSGVTLAMGLVRSFEAMLLLRVLQAVFQSFFLPAGAALVVAHHPPNRHAFALAVFLAGSVGGNALCASGGWIAEHFRWETGFRAAGAIGIVYGLFLALVLRDRLEDTSIKRERNALGKRRGSFFSLLRSRFFLVLLAANGLFGAANWILSAWLPHFFHVERNFNLTLSAIFGTLTVNVSSLLGMFFFSRLSDRIGADVPSLRSLIPAGALIVMAPVLYTIGWISSPAPTLMVLGIAGFAVGAIDPNLMPLLCRGVPSDLRATAYGCLNFAATALGGLSIFLGGYLKQNDVALTTSIQMAAVFFAVSGFLFLASRKTAIPHDDREFAER